ncbi:MAG: hypothetical protein BAJATHORv1_10138 [Candidatus Thorarchaeota archaeon]|nr:MAG: hypothetical protein BAJATHORv1_10138 [Candidatus Thorarchaeota archaeon]
MDTAKDARILVLEDALRRLNDIVGNRKLKLHIEYSKLNNELKTAGSRLYEIKYAYTDSQALADSEATKSLVESIRNFSNIVKSAMASSGFNPTTTKDQLVHAELHYCFRIVEGFQQRLLDYDEDPAYAVDILAVEVSQIQGVPTAEKLTVCRCTDGTRIWRIVTNIPNIESGSKLACVVLPPVEMMGVVSEAMFLGDTRLHFDTPLGLLVEPPSHALDQARAQVLQITKRMV